MKTLLNNTSISRREIIRGMMLLGVTAFLPSIILSVLEETSQVNFIGLGKSGTNTIEFLHRKGVKGEYTSIAKSLKPELSKNINFIPFNPINGSSKVIGKDVMGNLEYNESIEISELIINFFKKKGTFVLISGLGGFTGTFLTQKITLLLQNSKIPFLTITSIPFNYEGKLKQSIAQQAVDNLKHIDNFMYYKLEDMREKYGHLPFEAAFNKIDEIIFEMYASYS